MGLQAKRLCMHRREFLCDPLPGAPRVSRRENFLTSYCYRMTALRPNINVF
jgi:hypothetical protein